MKNCTTVEEARRFDEIVSEFGFPRVFTPWPALEPFSHGESLQRMVDQTTDEIIVVCDVDAFPIARGWDDFIVRELATKDAVGAIVHIPERSWPQDVPASVLPRVPAVASSRPKRWTSVAPTATRATGSPNACSRTGASTRGT